MCGICGEIRFDGSPASAAAVAEVTQRMRRRGPHGTGLLARDHVALGHRRLRIIDVSERSQQPLVDSDLGLSVVYNGAIYNYPELRRELEDLGYRMFSAGDTEVILKAYHAWGESFVERLNGMFAFAILERDTGQVVLGRDRLGIKPLYVARFDGGVRFASSLPALLSTGGLDTRIDPIALNHYMTFHSVVPGGRTLLRGIRRLPPGSLMRIQPDGAARVTTYWELRFEPRPEDPQTESDWRDLVLTTLRRAVDRRMVADVPVGVLLSGGLDSSLIVGLLAEAGQEHLETFSIGFETVGGEAGDEFRYSDVIAERFHTKHHKIECGSTETLENIWDCIGAMSEPMVSHDNIGFYLLSKAVSEHVTVVQSGQGADEIFGGYHWYPPLLHSQSPVDDYARVFFDRDHEEYCRVVHPVLRGQDYSRMFVERHFAQDGASRPVDKALRLDSTVMLVEDPVKRVDNMTMAWGLEARVPFLDHEVVELAARIPAELKIQSGGKHVLKEAARSVLPAAVIDRPKGYFPVPALKYLRGPVLTLVRDLLTSQTARSRRLLEPEYVDALLEAPDEHITPLRGSKLWQLAILEAWLQKNGIGSEEESS
jgi:asparagine synthase (glutamine-hydrolysing)